MKTQLTIEEAIECFGRPFIAYLLEGALESVHRLDIRAAWVNANGNSTDTYSRENRDMLRKISELNLCIAESDVYSAERRKVTKRRRRKLLSIPMPETLDDALKGMSSSELISQLDSILKEGK